VFGFTFGVGVPIGFDMGAEPHAVMERTNTTPKTSVYLLFIPFLLSHTVLNLADMLSGGHQVTLA
jgi:hypothetical protein